MSNHMKNYIEKMYAQQQLSSGINLLDLFHYQLRKALIIEKNKTDFHKILDRNSKRWWGFWK